MIDYLVDTSALWRLSRDDGLMAVWLPRMDEGEIGSCAPQRAEFRRSARNVDEYDEYNQAFARLFPDVPIPKRAWEWVETAQYRLVRKDVLKALSVVDLLVCATAAAHGMVVLHDDNDFVTATRHLPDVRERRVHLAPEDT